MERRNAVVSLVQSLTISLWLVSLHTPTHAQEAVSHRLPGWVGAVAYSPDGRLLATGSSDHVVRLWEAATVKEVAAFQGHSDYVASVAFSPDGKLLASASFDGTARLWDAAAHKVTAVLRGHRGVVMSVAFNPDGTTLATGGLDGTVRLWMCVRKQRVEGHSTATSPG